MIGRRFLALVLACLLGTAVGPYAQSTTPPPSTPPPAVQVEAVPPQGRGSVPPERAGRGGRQGQPDPDGPLTAAQVEQMFDSYALVQAQTELGLADAQLGAFTRRFQMLQNIRRRGQRQRQILLRELNALVATPGPLADPAAVTAKIQQMDDELVQTAQQVRRAYGAIDEVLNPRQRAHFRAFEFRMERKKLELLARAQAAARGGGVRLP